MVLQIARTDFGVDGLTPHQILKILSEKFRINTTKNAVAVALGRSLSLVSRQSDGKTFKYKIMNPGEVHLANLNKDGSQSSTKTASKTKKAKPAAKKTSATKKKAKPSNSNRKVGNRPGPKQSLEQLIADRFFDTPKEISDIISHLKNGKALTYKATDLSPTLIRLLREGKLERTTNQQGRYEYSTKS